MSGTVTQDTTAVHSGHMMTSRNAERHEYIWIDGWMERRTDGWMDEWMSEWLDMKCQKGAVSVVS